MAYPVLVYSRIKLPSQSRLGTDGSRTTIVSITNLIDVLYIQTHIQTLHDSDAYLRSPILQALSPLKEVPILQRRTYQNKKALEGGRLKLE